jgi:hypothetical protein
MVELEVRKNWHLQIGREIAPRKKISKDAEDSTDGETSGQGSERGWHGSLDKRPVV